MAVRAAGSARMAIVKQTLTTSSTFFVGWSFVVFFRDLAAVTGQGAVELRHAALLPPLAAERAAAPADDAEREGLVAFAGALGGVLLFGPLLSVAVLSAKHLLVAQLAAISSAPPAAEEGSVRRGQRASARARLVRLGLCRSAPSAAPGAAPAAHAAAPGSARDDLHRARSAPRPTDDAFHA